MDKLPRHIRAWADRTDPEQYIKLTPEIAELIAQEVDDPLLLGQETARFEALADHLAQKFPNGLPTPVMEVGSGIGHLIKVLMQRFNLPPSQVWASDVSPTLCRKGAENVGISFLQWDVHKPAPEGYAGVFNLVLVPEVLYHFEKDMIPVFSKNIADIVAPGGFLVLTEVVKTMKYSNGFKEFLNDLGYQRINCFIPSWKQNLSYRVRIFQKPLEQLELPNAAN